MYKKLKNMNKKQWTGLISLPIAFSLLSYSLNKAPKTLTVPLGATILLIFGYKEGITKIEKTNNPIKLTKEILCSFFFILGIGLFYYTYTITKPWVLILITGGFLFYISRKYFLSNLPKEKIEKREKEIEKNNNKITAYLKKNIVPILFLLLFITSFTYSENQTLLKIEAAAFIIILILNRLYWTSAEDDSNEN